MTSLKLHFSTRARTVFHATQAGDVFEVWTTPLTRLLMDAE